MSGTVNYPKVIYHLTDVIKELNVPCGEAAPAAPSEETRRADAVDLLKALLSELENVDADAAAEAAAAIGVQTRKSTTTYFTDGVHGEAVQNFLNNPKDTTTSRKKGGLFKQRP